MQNLVKKFTPAVEATDDDGVVAIEYVVVAAAIVAGLALVFTGAFGALTTRLTDIIGDI